MRYNSIRGNDMGCNNMQYGTILGAIAYGGITCGTITCGEIQVPKGPQLKIQYAARKKLEEMGMETGVGGKGDDEGNPWEKEKKAARAAAGGQGDSDGKCCVCWEADVQVIYRT